MSPIRVLDKDLINSVARIAPEKFSNLESFQIDHEPTAVFTNDQKFRFRVNTDSNEVKLPTSALEYLWCSCYTFYVVYREYCSANQSDSCEFDLLGTEELRKANSLYLWSIKQLNAPAREEWPIDLPKPEEGEAVDEAVKVANDLYLCAGAWIIHHEFAHIYHGHENEPLNDVESRKQETEADKSATDWILSGVTDEAVLNKRGMGVAIANLVITAQDILGGEFKETTHPKSFQRLYDSITPYYSDYDHPIYAFSTVICHLNMAASGMQINKNDEETWKENLETCLFDFSRLTSQSTRTA